MAPGSRTDAVISTQSMAQVSTASGVKLTSTYPPVGVAALKAKVKVSRRERSAELVTSPQPRGMVP